MSKLTMAAIDKKYFTSKLWFKEKKTIIEIIVCVLVLYHRYLVDIKL